MEELKGDGLFIDDIYRLRVDEPNFANNKITLRHECFQYSTNLHLFKKVAYGFYNISEAFAKDVDEEKLLGIGIQNQLKTIAKQRQNEQQVYQSQLFLKNVQLDRLKNEHQYLQRIETEQHEIINQFFLSQY
ncbi:hypothetical protein KR009_000491 [Drosophila setifemur]|nr:hypothetical protein KR009_000491 [Drosophila setifemur]